MSQSIVLSDKTTLDHPSTITSWTDDTRYWPPVDYLDIRTYMIESKSVDGKAMKGYKGFTSYNYFLSGWVVSKGKATML